MLKIVSSLQLAEIKRTSEQYNDELDKAIDAMNSTISEQVRCKRLHYQCALFCKLLSCAFWLDVSLRKFAAKMFLSTECF